MWWGEGERGCHCCDLSMTSRDGTRARGLVDRERSMTSQDTARTRGLADDRLTQPRGELSP